MGISDSGFIKRLRRNHILAISTGLVYLWFGYLKFMPGCSPAEELAKSTIHKLTFGLIPDSTSIILLAIWETCIGLLLILNIFRKPVVYAAIIHLILTFTPFFFFPELTFTHPPFGYSLIGQYIAKNVILIAGMITLLRQEPLPVTDMITRRVAPGTKYSHQDPEKTRSAPAHLFEDES